MRTWLPAAVEDRESASAKAVSLLAQLLKQYHSDTWLQDFLSHTSSSDLSATKMLSAAFNYDWNDLHRQAIRESQKAAAIFAQHNNLPGELRANYQEVYGLQRSLAADDCLLRANELWKRLFKTTYRSLQAELALEKASCANMNFDFDTTAINIETSRNIASKFGFPELALRVAGYDAGIQKGQENYRQSWKMAAQGLGIYWEGECAGRTANARPAWRACSYSLERLYQFYSVMQQCARKIGLHHTSEALLLQGISILENSAPNDVSLRATLYLRLADILSRQGDIELADEKAVKAESLLKEIPTHEPTGQLYAAVTRIELAEFELNRGNPAVALSKIEPLRTLLGDQDDFVRLDFYTVQGKIFWQLKRVQDAIKSYQFGIEIAEGFLANPQDRGSQLNWILGTGKTYRGLIRALLARGQEEEALSVWERFQKLSLNTEKNRLSQDSKVKPAGDLSSSPLPSVPQPHLIYASFEDGLQIWVVSGSETRSKWINIKQEDLLRQVHEFARECSNPSLSLDVASSLYSLFLQPIVGDLPHSRVIAVELDELLWGLTFEALRSPDGRYFADDYTVVYSPGLFAEASLRQPEPIMRQNPMLLVDASQATSAPLPGHADEVNAVKNTFTKTEILGPGTVTLSAINKALGRSNEFHFSGHGKSEGTGTSLVIASDLFLGAKDFAPERLKHLQLAVLSACASGSAKQGAFDQSNLVRTFLSGGVPSVIASRWDVDSKSTAQFMSSFYTHLRKGEAPAQAIQRAQAEMRMVHDHPYYWAAFTLAGRAN